MLLRDIQTVCDSFQTSEYFYRDEHTYSRILKIIGVFLTITLEYHFELTLLF